MKLNLAVIFGSRTCEHDVSIVSAMQAMEAAEKGDYNVTPVYIAPDGAWYVGAALRDIAFFSNFDPAKVQRVLPSGEDGKLKLIKYPTDKRALFAPGRVVLEEADVVLPVMHGVNGEDGTLSGMLELFDVPYAASGVLGSAVGMDKIAMKILFRGCGFPVLDAEYLERGQWRGDPDGVIERIERALSYPVYVKPANLGSSIGISRASNRDELIRALDVAASFDRRLLVEKGVTKLTEVNCSVLGYGAQARASVLEMPISGETEKFLGFDEKYLQGGKNSAGMKSLARKVPAPIGEEMTRRVQDMALDAFRVMDCKGVVRIDFIIDGEDGALYINEINTIPGSLAFYLWEHEGLNFTALIDEMVKCAYRAAADRRESVFSYESDILKHQRSGKLTGKTNGKAK